VTARHAAACLLLAWAAHACAADSSLLPPLVDATGGIGPGWRSVLLPRQKVPSTRFVGAQIYGERVLRIESDGSYGTLVAELDGTAARARWLAWRWRLDVPVAGADLTRRAGDDAAVKVCALFDLPLDRVPFVERALLRLARALTGEDLPAAALCYVWDATLPAGHVLPNIYTRRLRWVVLKGAESPAGQWASEQRDLHADFQHAFGDETNEVPPLKAVLVGADADNTGARGLAHVAALALFR
jgi:hypothetical protein